MSESQRLLLQLGYSACALLGLLLAMFVGGVALPMPFGPWHVAAGVMIGGLLLVFWLAMIMDHLAHEDAKPVGLVTVLLVLAGVFAAAVYFLMIVVRRRVDEGATYGSSDGTSA